MTDDVFGRIVSDSHEREELVARSHKIMADILLLPPLEKLRLAVDLAEVGQDLRMVINVARLAADELSKIVRSVETQAKLKKATAPNATCAETRSSSSME